MIAMMLQIASATGCHIQPHPVPHWDAARL
jgi:hypothetical protein